jgi:hypothetical protein
MADFCLISRRTLDDLDSRIFRLHYLHGADFRACCRQLRIDKGSFFHRVYAIQEQLGSAFAGTAPYSLYPVDEYFAGGRTLGAAA